MNNIIIENKKNKELIINHITNLQNQMNQNFKELKNNNEQVIKYDNGKYIGQVVNGLREGKGIYYFNNGDRYEGDFKNDNKEGKGIYYWNNGDRYEGDWKNDNKEGKGIYYWNNGDREMGDFLNGNPIGKHVILTINGEVIVNNY